MKTLLVSNEFPAGADGFRSRLLDPDTFRFIAQGFIAAEPIDPLPACFASGVTLRLKLRYFHFIPSHEHCIAFLAVDPQRRVVEAREEGGLIRQ